MSRLRVSEIFYSLQGESRSIGVPTAFIRLTGCPLRCAYCDSDFAFSGGEWMELPQILAQVAGYKAHYVTVTGGEPLAQPATLKLLQALCDKGYEVSLETSGALDVSKVDSRVVTVMDLKTPGSGECDANNFKNLNHLNKGDQIKIVICDQADYTWAKEQIEKWDLPSRCEVLLSPAAASMDARTLAEWILRDGLRVRFQVQLHKILWGDERSR